MIKFTIGDKCMFIALRDLKDSLKSLKSLLKRVEKRQLIHFENVGICGNWESDFSYALVLRYGSQWPKSAHPGKLHPYPIKSNDEGLWEGTNLELRIDLMKFIVSELEQLIEEFDN